MDIPVAGDVIMDLPADGDLPDFNGTDTMVSVFAVTEVLKERAEFVATIVLVGLVLLRAGLWVTRNKKLAVGVIGAWVLWFGIGVMRGTTSPEDAVKRFNHMYDASTMFLKAGFNLCSAWGALVTPLFSDLAELAIVIWGEFTMEQRLAAVFAVGIVWAVMKIVTKAQEHKDSLKEAGFQLSFLLVGPALWKLLFLLPAAWLINLLTILTTIIPTAMSVRSYHRARSNARSQRETTRCWLSYWTCWPTIVFVISITSSFAENIQELHVGMLILLVWLQFWRGSILIPDLLMKLLKNLGYPLLQAVVGSLPSVLTNPFELVRRYYTTVWTYVTHNKLTAGVAALITAGVLVRVFATISDLLTLCVWWGIGLKTTEVIGNKHHHEYQAKLGFWIISMVFEGITQIPAIGTVASLWEPIVLVIATLFSESILDFVLDTAQRMFPTVVHKRKTSERGAEVPPGK